MDIDIAPAYDAENLDRLGKALRGLRARIRAEGAPNGLPFDCSGEFLRNLGPDGMLNLTTRYGDVDLAFTPSGTGGFADLKTDAVTMSATGVSLLVASLADVIRSASLASG